MTLTREREATVYVAEHQEIDLTERRYYVKDPFDPEIKYKAKTTGALIRLVSESMRRERIRQWRWRIGGVK